MNPPYIKRLLEPILKKAASEFPAVVLTGPRQSGKTTLLQHLFGRRCRYVSLEPPDVQASAVEDPRTFLEMYPPPVIFNEVQYAPDLIRYIKEKIDANPAQERSIPIDRFTESVACREGARVFGRSCGDASLVAAFQTGSGGKATNFPAMEVQAPIFFKNTLCFWRAVEKAPERWLSRTCHATRPGCTPVACQLYPDLSRTGRANAQAGWGPESVSEFPPSPGGQKRSTPESDRGRSGPRSRGQHDQGMALCA